MNKFLLLIWNETSGLLVQIILYFSKSLVYKIRFVHAVWHGHRIYLRIWLFLAYILTISKVLLLIYPALLLNSKVELLWGMVTLIDCFNKKRLKALGLVEDQLLQTEEGGGWLNESLVIGVLVLNSCHNTNSTTTQLKSWVWQGNDFPPPPPPPKTQHQQYLHCNWPNFDKTLNVG